MSKLTIGEVAKKFNISTETLRHYDRIGLFKPSFIDEYTNYRYYQESDLFRLKTILLLKNMDISLDKISDILNCEDLNKIINDFEKIEYEAKLKIERIQESISKLNSVKSIYKNFVPFLEINDYEYMNLFKIKQPIRYLILVEYDNDITIDTLWKYHKNFSNYSISNTSIEYKDTAGLFIFNNKKYLIAELEKCTDSKVNIIFEEGEYQALVCTKEDLIQGIDKIKKISKDDKIYVFVNVIGLLKWNYVIMTKNPT